MDDSDLDDSTAVELLTWVLYLGWLSVLSSFILYVGVEPLPTIQARFDGWLGTAAAIATGVVFIAASRRVFDVLRARFRGPTAPSAAAPSDPVPIEEEASEDAAPSGSEKRKRKRKKKKKKRR